MPDPTLLTIIAVIVLAVALGGVIAFLYARARRAGAEGSPSAPASKQDLLRQKEEQVTRIRQRIEELYKQQQQEQRVQHAQLSQQMDDVKLHLETNDRKVDGLRNELHHEIERRNEELAELRHQLAGALDAFWKTHDALPGGPHAAPRMLTAGEAAPGDEAAQSAASQPEAPARRNTTAHEASSQAASAPPFPADDFSGGVSDSNVFAPFDALAQDAPNQDDSPQSDSPQEAPFQDVPPQPNAFDAPEPHDVPEPQSAPDQPNQGAPPAGDTLQWQSFDFAASLPRPNEENDAPEPIADAADPFAASGDSPTPDAPLPTFASFDSFTDTPAESDTPQPAGRQRPDGADDLTTISSIDEDIETQLYAREVYTLDQIARWSRTEARHVAQELGLRPHVVMDQWVFEAQSVLFDQYQQQLTA